MHPLCSNDVLAAHASYDLLISWPCFLVLHYTQNSKLMQVQLEFHLPIMLNQSWQAHDVLELSVQL